MSTSNIPLTTLPQPWTLADLQATLGNVPLSRIRGYPYPGTATVADVVAIRHGEGRLYELVDGTLVEKPVGFYESRLAALLVYFLEAFLEEHDLGIVLGADGPLQILPQQVRMADASFLAWHHFPNRALPVEAVPQLAPDLAIEVLSASNTDAEMRRKVREYFEAGTHLVWIIDPGTQSARIYSSADQFRTLARIDSLDGGEILPGFQLQLETLFARAGHRTG